MQRYKKIATIWFLSIFSMYLLHPLLPHVHHVHESTEHIAVLHAEHTHDSEHHHHDKDAHEDFDLLGFHLGTHGHSVHADNVLVAKSVVKQQSTLRIGAVAATSQTGIFSNRVRDLEEQVFWQDPPDPTKTPYLSSGSLRGPPSLG